MTSTLNPTTFLASSLTLTLPPQAGAITALAWSENNERLAAVSSAGSLIVWDTTSGTCLLQQRITRSPLCAVAWSRQGRSLLLGSEQGVLSVFHLSTRTLVCSSTFADPISQIALSPNVVDTRFFVRSGCTLHLLTQGKPEAQVLRYFTPLVDTCWNADGQWLAVVCQNGLVEIRDTRTRRIIWRQQRFHAPASQVTWDASGQRLAIGTRAGTVQVQDLQTGQTSDAIPLSRFPIQALGWGERYLVAGSASDLAFWNGSDQPPQSQLTQTMPTLRFDSQGTILATALQGAVTLATLA